MEKFRYIPLGDSYTIGEGAKLTEAWPSVLVDNLKQNGVNIELLCNPSVTGWTTQDLIYKELPIFDQFSPNFVTLLIGVNDWVQEVPKSKFELNLKYILDHVQFKLSDPSKIVLVTIPDFGVTPDGSKYGKGRNISEGLTEFNEVIKREGRNRNLPVVDIFPISKNMATDPTLVAADQLHGSAKMYGQWEELIRPEVLKVLKP